MKIVKYVSLVLLPITLIIILLCVSFIIPSFSTSVYMNQFDRLGVAQQIGISRDDLLLVTQNIQRYMLGRDPELDVVVSIHGQVRPFFSEREILHMIDVLFLYDTGFKILWASVFVFLIVCILIIRKKYFYEAAKSLSIGIGSFLAASGILVTIIALNFDRAFVIFHEIFFDNDLWLLDPRTDLMINIMPQQFFINISAMIAMYFLGSMLAVFAASLYYWVSKAKRKRKPLRFS